MDKYVLAFDSANEVIAAALGRLDDSEGKKRIDCVVSFECAAHRASNTQLLPAIDAMLKEANIKRTSLACVAVGTGPGSFTGVRIALATAKGIASALELPLIGISTLDAVAWAAQSSGMRGRLLVAADAMRKEVYPVQYRLSASGIERLDADCVMSAQAAAEALPFAEGATVAQTAEFAEGVHQDEVLAKDAMIANTLPPAEGATVLQITGDALVKYGELFVPRGKLLPEKFWTPTGSGLLLALQAAWQKDEAYPFDAQKHKPSLVLPVYTRLSDAEENERARLAKSDEKNLVSGVQGEISGEVCGQLHAESEPRTEPEPAPHAELESHTDSASESASEPAPYAAKDPKHLSMHAASKLTARADEQGIVYKPLDSAHASCVSELEAHIMGSDAWSERMVKDELPRKNRSWWAAYDVSGNLLGYAGGLVNDAQVQILKVGVCKHARKCGIARELLTHVCDDARNLGAQVCSLEVRKTNTGAQAFYKALGFCELGCRPHYYSDKEDALIMEGALVKSAHDVAGMHLHIDEARVSSAPDPHVLSARLSGTQATCTSSTPNPCALNTPDPHASTTSQAQSLTRPLILAIESSCDETAAAIVDGSGNLVADVVASQIDFHARFGGVVPEIASRKHIEAICGVCDECLRTASVHLNTPHLFLSDLDAIACTYAPGLVGALVVGVAFAKGAAWGTNLPFIGVNHLEGHLYANKIGTPDFSPPALVSLVSGGNTLLVYMRDWQNYETLGATIDDAVGEAFDKVAKALGLGYPGGPTISRAAQKGDPDAIAFPRAMLHSGDLRFSLSGLKTAVVSYIEKERQAKRELNIPDICASFQQAVIDVQIAKARTALHQTGSPTFCLGGGVAANKELRTAYEKLCEEEGVRLVLPPLAACGDNAGMIALVALDRYKQHKFFALDADALAHTNLDEPY